METNTLKRAQLDHLWGLGSAWSRPATLYFALYLAMPTVAGGGTEVSGGAYARVAVTAGSSNFARTDDVITNVNDIDWAEATTDWGNVVGCGVHTHPTNNTLIGFGELDDPRTVLDGDTFTLPATTGFSHTKVNPS